MKRQIKYSGNQFWNNILLDEPNFPPSDTPTVTTDSLNMLFSANANIDGTVVSEGTDPLMEYGFVWATHDTPTVSDHKVVVDTGSFTGAYEATIGSLGFPATVYFRAYAANLFGTSYGTTLSGDTQICFAAGTLITLANGNKKKIEHIQYTDDLLVWDFDNGRFNSAKPVWMVKPFNSSAYTLLRFGNGTKLKTVADGRGHRIFNNEESKFTYSVSDSPIGTTTFTERNERPQLISREMIKETTTFYNIITHKHINVFANGILTSTGLNNIYPMVNMKFVKNNRKLRERAEFWDIPEDLFIGLRLGEQPKSYAGLKEKIDRLVVRQLAAF